jgi:hypothetical protein
MVNEKPSGPLFVVGLWRSGTSLFYSLLNKHPEIALMYEADLPLLPGLFRSTGAKADWMERWEFWNQALSRHRIDRQRVSADASDLRSAAESVWKQYAGDAIWGEKSPNYYDSLRWLVSQFPNARFIVIWRDPADICRSILRAAESGSSFFAKSGITHRALIGTRRLKSECDAIIQQGIAVHQIQYEEMIKDPQRVLSGVCEFLEIPFDPHMASLDGADRSAIYDAEHHAGVNGTAIRRKNGKGREEVLPESFKNKVERYVCYWQRQYNGTWPLYPKLQGKHAQPSLLERAYDETKFRFYRAFDKFTSLVYCYAPISLLRRYRAAKANPEADATKRVREKSPAIPEVSPRA